MKFDEGTGLHGGRRSFPTHTFSIAPANPQGRIPADAEVVKVDDYTVDFILKNPNPLLINEWESWAIFLDEMVRRARRDRSDGDERHDPPYAALHANGTGPFILVSHEPGAEDGLETNATGGDTPKDTISTKLSRADPERRNARRRAPLGRD